MSGFQKHWDLKAKINSLEGHYNSALSKIVTKKQYSFPAPGTYREFIALSAIQEETGPLSATRMIELLVEGQETVVRTARSVFPVVEQNHDAPTADLLTERMQAHEKMGWMLRSLLENK